MWLPLKFACCFDPGFVEVNRELLVFGWGRFPEESGSRSAAGSSGVTRYLASETSSDVFGSESYKSHRDQGLCQGPCFHDCRSCGAVDSW